MLRLFVLAGILAALTWLTTVPARPGWKLTLSAAGGMGCLIVLNLLSSLTGMVFELNVLTAAVAGALGMPGLGCLLIAQFILSH